jgi:hypothetical protein
MDTKLKRPIAFHPETDGQREVVNRTLVQLLSCYNQKHLETWDENLIYIQHSYNITVHTSIGKSPFETFFGYFPPSPLDVVYQRRGVREDLIGDALKEEKIVEKIKKIHLQVQETLKKSRENYKDRYDQHRKETTFRVGDRVCL